MLPKSGRPLGPGGKGGFLDCCIRLTRKKDSDVTIAVTRTREKDISKDEARRLWHGVIL